MLDANKNFTQYQGHSIHATLRKCKKIVRKRRLTIKNLGIFDDVLCREKTTNGVEEIFSLHWYFLGSYANQTDYIMPFTVT